MATTLVVAHWPRLDCELLCRNFEARRSSFRLLGWSLEGADSLLQIAQQCPDVALLSSTLREGPSAGFEVLHQLSSSRHPTRVVMLLPPSEDDLVLQAFSAGAKGVLFQDEGFKVVCKCLRCVHAGQVWVSTHHTHLILETLAQRRQLQLRDVKGKSLLTKREEEIVRMLAEGLPNLEIAGALHLSPHTVKNHLFRIYEKLGISNRAELILYALSTKRAAPVNEGQLPRL